MCRVNILPKLAGGDLCLKFVKWQACCKIYLFSFWSLQYRSKMEDKLHRYLAYAVIGGVSVGVLKWAWPRAMAAIMAYMTKKCAYASEDLKKELFGSLEELQRQLGSSLAVLELGAGTGSNFKYFPEGAQVIALEPNVHCSKYLEQHASEWKHVTLTQIICYGAEDMHEDVHDEAVDVVVCTLVLCSVSDVKQVLAEIRRVLKPGGRFYFLEHGEDPQRNSWLHIRQRLAYPFFKYIGDCDLLNNNWAIIETAGFSSVQYERKMAPKPVPGIFRPQILGYAVK